MSKNNHTLHVRAKSDRGFWRGGIRFHREATELRAADLTPDQLAAIRGRFILTINDTPGAREVFGRFHVDAVPTTYTVGGGAQAKKVSELLVSNFAL